MLPMRRKESLTILHTHHRTPSYPKDKEWGREKKKDPHWKQEKVNKEKIQEES